MELSLGLTYIPYTYMDPLGMPLFIRVQGSYQISPAKTLVRWVEGHLGLLQDDSYQLGSYAIPRP